MAPNRKCAILSIGAFNERAKWYTNQQFDNRWNTWYAISAPNDIVHVQSAGDIQQNHGRSIRGFQKYDFSCFIYFDLFQICIVLIDFFLCFVPDIPCVHRAHRIGQHKTSYVYCLVSVGTMEEKIYQVVSIKKPLASTCLTVKKLTTYNYINILGKLYKFFRRKYKRKEVLYAFSFWIPVRAAENRTTRLTNQKFVSACAENIHSQAN